MIDPTALPPLALVWIALAIGLAGLVHGTLGLGFPLVATPLIATVTDVKTAVVLVAPPTLAVVIASILRHPGFAATVREHWQMPVWAFAGSVIGTQIFIAIDPTPLTLLLALGICVYLCMDLFGRGESRLVQTHRRKFGMLFGLAGGLFEGAVNIAVPPLLIYFLALGLGPVAMVQALNLSFGVGKFAQIATLFVSGNVPWAAWAATLPLCAIGLIVQRFGMRVRERIEAATYRRWLKLALAAIALLLFAQYALRTATAA